MCIDSRCTCAKYPVERHFLDLASVTSETGMPEVKLASIDDSACAPKCSEEKFANSFDVDDATTCSETSSLSFLAPRPRRNTLTMGTDYPSDLAPLLDKYRIIDVMKYCGTEKPVTIAPGQCALYRGLTNNGEKVCIKVVTGAPKDTSMVALKKENTNLANLRGDSRYQQLVEYREFAGFAVLITEMYDMDLFTLLDTAEQEEGEATMTIETGFVQQVCQTLIGAVVGLHKDFNTAHLDIKPENIFVRYPCGLHPTGREWRAADFFKTETFAQFTLVIGDFGFTHPISKDGHVLKYDGKIGSPGYMSPEMDNNESWNADLADIFALGRTLFTVVIGFPPWDIPADTDAFFSAWKFGLREKFWDAMAHYCEGRWDPIDSRFVELMEMMLELDQYRRSDMDAILNCAELFRGRAVQ